MPARVTSAGSAVRLAVCALAALVWLMAAADARAQDGSAAEDPATDVIADPAPEGTAPVDESVQQPPPEQTPGEQPLPAEQPAPDPAPVDQTPPPEQPAQEPPAEPTPPVSETPLPEPPASEAPVVEPSPTPEPPVVTPAPGDLVPEPPVLVPEPSPVEVEPGTGPQHGSIVTIPRDLSPPSFPLLSSSLPLLFPSPGGGDAAVTWAGGRVDTQSGSRSDARQDGRPAAGSTGEAPQLPPLPLRERAPSGFYVSAGGAGGGSSGGFVPLVLAALIAFFVAAAQRPGGLVSLALAPPRCTAFVLCLERPD